MEQLVHDLLAEIAKRGGTGTVWVAAVVFIVVGLPLLVRLSREFLSPRNRFELAKLRMEILSAYKAATSADVSTQAQKVLDEAQLFEPHPLRRPIREADVHAFLFGVLKSLACLVLGVAGATLVLLPPFFLIEKLHWWWWLGLVWLWLSNGLAGSLTSADAPVRNLYTVSFAVGIYAVLSFILLVSGLALLS
ncbi:MAG TPA: hypothetical protein VGM13_05850 [Thermoanaerobaculia bacterium]|jgi:hypothetical protein